MTEQDDEREPVEDGSLCQRTAPESIYLQISDDRYHYDEEFPANDEVTWCRDSVLSCEVRYVRADLARASVAAPPREPERDWAAINGVLDQGGPDLRNASPAERVEGSTMDGAISATGVPQANHPTDAPASGEDATRGPPSTLPIKTLIARDFDKKREPMCLGDPGECEYHGGCQYSCGRAHPPAKREG